MLVVSEVVHVCVHVCVCVCVCVRVCACVSMSCLYLSESLSSFCLVSVLCLPVSTSVSVSASLHDPSSS